MLVVEDEPALRGLATVMIERLGYRVAGAADGAAALALVEGEGLRPDLGAEALLDGRPVSKDPLGAI